MLSYSYPYEVPSTIAYGPLADHRAPLNLSILHTSLTLKGTGIRIKGELMGGRWTTTAMRRYRTLSFPTARSWARPWRGTAHHPSIKSKFPWKEFR